MMAEYSSSSAKRSEHFTKPKPLTTQRKKKSKNTRRFSEEQMKSLESIFKQETKLDQRTMAKVARELGLQPRQVAIWFQNKRARWKSKQIEQDYRILKADYDNLNSHFESLKREKQSLFIQLQKLRELQKCHCDGDKESKNWEENAAAEMSYDKDIALEFQAKQNCSNEGLDSGDAKEQNSGYLGQEEESDPQNQCEQEDASGTQPAKWSNFELGGFLDESCEPSNWWDFWT